MQPKRPSTLWYGYSGYYMMKIQPFFFEMTKMRQKSTQFCR